MVDLDKSLRSAKSAHPSAFARLYPRCLTLLIESPETAVSEDAITQEKFHLVGGRSTRRTWSTTSKVLTRPKTRFLQRTALAMRLFKNKLHSSGETLSGMSISRFGAASAEGWEPAGPSTSVSGFSIPCPDSDRDPTLAFRYEAQIDSLHFVANATSQLIFKHAEIENDIHWVATGQPFGVASRAFTLRGEGSNNLGRRTSQHYIKVKSSNVVPIS